MYCICAILCTSCVPHMSHLTHQLCTAYAPSYAPAVYRICAILCTSCVPHMRHLMYQLCTVYAPMYQLCTAYAPSYVPAVYRVCAILCTSCVPPSHSPPAARPGWARSSKVRAPAQPTCRWEMQAGRQTGRQVWGSSGRDKEVGLP